MGNAPSDPARKEEIRKIYEEKQRRLRVIRRRSVTILAVAVFFCGFYCGSIWGQSKTNQTAWDLEVEQGAKTEMSEVQLEAEKGKLSARLIHLTRTMLQFERQKLAMEISVRAPEPEVSWHFPMPEKESMLEAEMLKLMDQNIKLLQGERAETAEEMEETAAERIAAEKNRYSLKAEVEELAAKMAEQNMERLQDETKKLTEELRKMAERRAMIEEKVVKLEAEKEELAGKIKENLKLLETDREENPGGIIWRMFLWIATIFALLCCALILYVVVGAIAFLTLMSEILGYKMPPVSR